MIGKVIHNALLQNTAVKSVVEDRIYPIIIPQDTDLLPAITYQITNLNVIKSKGTTTTLDGNVEINAYTKTYSEVQDLTLKIINALDRNITTNTIDEQTVLYLSYQSYSDGFEEDAQVYMVSLDFYVRKPYNNE